MRAFWKQLTLLCVFLDFADNLIAETGGVMNLFI